MADSARQRLVTAIVARLAAINGTGSYELNLAGRAADSRTAWHGGDDDTPTELPAVSVFDHDATPNPTIPSFNKSTIWDLDVLIKGFTDAAATPATARKLLKDIKTAIRQDEQWTVSGTALAMQTFEDVERITRTPDTFEVDGCELHIKVQYRTGKFNAELA